MGVGGLGIWRDIQDGVIQTAQTVLPYIMQRGEENRAQARAKELMDIQVNHQKDLNAQGQGLQLSTWEATNYPAQIKMMKEAGLNPGLLYGKGGGGGTTTGTQGGGSAAMASPNYAPLHTMDLMSNIATMENIRLTRAATEKTEAEKRAIEAGIPKTGAETKNIESNTALNEIKTEIERINLANRQYQIDAELTNIAETTNKLRLENKLSAENMQNIIDETRAKAIGQLIQNDLTNANIGLTNTQKQTMITGIQQKWTELQIQGARLDLESAQQKINKFEAEVKAEYPNLFEVAGGIAKKAYKTIQNIENLFKPGGAQDIKDTVK